MRSFIAEWMGKQTADLRSCLCCCFRWKRGAEEGAEKGMISGRDFVGVWCGCVFRGCGWVEVEVESGDKGGHAGEVVDCGSESEVPVQFSVSSMTCLA